MIKVPIFYYHSIGNQGPETLPLATFREHLDAIDRGGFQTITFSDLLRIHPQDRTRYVALTFDDGLLDNFDNAFPLLQEYGATATFFVIPGFDQVTRWVNPGTRQWSDEPRAGFTIPFPSMQPHHRRALLDAGMEIGCHSMTHPKLNKIPVERLPFEIVDSKKRLEDQLGTEITSFCYPKGRYNPTVLDWARRAGYRGACTTMPGFFRPGEKPLECPRFLIENSALFSMLLNRSGSDNHFLERLFGTIRPLLAIKNRYF